MSAVIARLSMMVKRQPALVRMLTPLVAAAKQTPMVGDGLRRALRSSGVGSFDPSGYVRTTAEQVGDQELVGPVNLIRYATRSRSAYAGEQFPAGYHTLRVGPNVVLGQREPGERLDLLTSDICELDGLSVLDLGSNQGGMSFAALERGARWVVGVDYDSRMVNTANRIAAARRDTGRAVFYTHDVDRDPHDLLRDFLPDETADIIFLLAVCAWIDCWEELIAWAAANSPRLLFESNGSPTQQRRQVEQLRIRYPVVRLLAEDSSDDGGVRRSLYFCSGTP
jgi:SAM-dependent methyltransferase